MSTQKNPNIGYIACECGQLAALRRDKHQRFYYDCLDCRRWAMTGEEAQSRVLERAIMFGESMPPPETPTWIAEQWPWGRASRDKAAARRPIGGDDQAPAKVSSSGRRAVGAPMPPPETAPASAPASAAPKAQPARFGSCMDDLLE